MKTLTQCQKNVAAYYDTRTQKDLARIDDFETAQDILSNWYFCGLLTTTQKKKAQSGGYSFEELKELVKAKEAKKIDKERAKALAQLDAIYQAEPLKHATCRIDWVKSRTWGMCPRGNYSNCHTYTEYKSVTGCGYDKLSTLTARMFNADTHALRLLVDYIDTNKVTTLKSLGYGAGCLGGVPSFDGGVGISCHISIFKSLGFKVTHTDTRSSDFISIDID